MADPLRVLVIGNLPPHVLGGAENQVARLVAEWLATGVRVDVAGHRIPDGRQLLGQGEVRTHHLRTWLGAGRAGKAISYFLSMALFCLARRSDYDVAYCRGMGDGAVSLAILSALGFFRWRLVGVPINAKGTGDAHFLRSIPGWRLWCLLLDRQLDAINLINNDIAADLDSLGITRPPRHRIPNGVLLRAPLVRTQVGRTRRLLWTGRFERQKGLDLLLRSLAVCRDDGHCFELRLYGAGPLQSWLEEQVAGLGLGPCVGFMGPIPEEAVRAKLAEGDAFVLPSRYEGMSNSALEAMEAGLPVLCTRCGGIDVEVATGAGWVCAPDDVAELLGALRAMFADSDQEVLAKGQRARRIVEARHSMAVIARENLSMMAEVARAARDS